MLTTIFRACTNVSCFRDTI